MTKTFAVCPITRSPGDANSITISTAAIDRERDRIMPDGCESDDFMRTGGPVLYGHDHRELPVAKTTALRRVATGIRATFQWLQGDDRASRVKNAFDQGLLCASIGFMPLERTPNECGGMDYPRWTLLEWSFVPVPANPWAVRGLKALGLVPDDEPVLHVLGPSDTELFLNVAEPDNRVIDVDPATLNAAVRSVLRESIRDTIRPAIRAAILRHTGRVD
jgi:hypothetical protein